MHVNSPLAGLIRFRKTKQIGLGWLCIFVHRRPVLCRRAESFGLGDGAPGAFEGVFAADVLVDLGD